MKSSKSSDGRQQVLLMLSDRGKREYFSTGFSATPKEFDASKDVGRFIQGRGIPSFRIERKEEDGSIKSYTNKEANDALAQMEERASAIIKRYNDNHINWGFEQFREEFINAPKREYFLSFAEKVVEKEYRDRGQFSTANTVKYTLLSMRRFDPAIDRRVFSEITAKYLSRYEAFCKMEGISSGTISIRTRVIKRIFNIAIREKIVSRELYPFNSKSDEGKYKIPKTKLTKTNQFLPIESLQKLANTCFKNHVMERDRHLFLFSYYCYGINWKDMAYLTQKNIDKTTATDGNEETVIRYQRAKTQENFEIYVNENIQKELDWFHSNTLLYKNFLLPIITKDVRQDKIDGYIAQKRKRFNATLKQIARKLELPESQLNLTSYHARHSVAMTLQNNGVPIEMISQVLGHQSVKTTKHYLARFSSKQLSKITSLDLSMPTEDEE